MPETTESVPLPQPGELWKHFRGGLYRVVCLALCEATGAELVVYAAASGKAPCWVRTLARWRQVVTAEGGSQSPRFVRVPEEAPTDPPDDKPIGPTAEQRSHH